MMDLDHFVIFLFEMDLYTDYDYWLYVVVGGTFW